jgi:probable HAF family extracellular repeat protein
MKRTICTALLLAVVAAVLMGTGPATGQPASPGQQYSITDLGTLPAGFESEAHGINNRGQIVGKSTAEFFLWHAFLWEKGKMTDLGSLGGIESRAEDINDRGQVVGSSRPPASINIHAFLWQDGKMTDLGTLRGGLDTVASGINNHGQVVGSTRFAIDAGTAETWRAFLWEKGKMTDLGTLHGGNFGMATDINDRGQVVGGSNASSVFRHAVLWTK